MKGREKKLKILNNKTTKILSQGQKIISQFKYIYFVRNKIFFIGDCCLIVKGLLKKLCPLYFLIGCVYVSLILEIFLNFLKIYLSYYFMGINGLPSCIM